MKKATLLLITLSILQLLPAQPQAHTPAQVYRELFKDVQMSRVFPDGKTFVDCVPKRDPKEIVKDYLAIKKNPAIRFSLELFVKENFELPPAPSTVNYVQQEKDVVMHIKNLWGALRREPDKAAPAGGAWVGAGSSFLPCPHPYVGPVGRSRQLTY